MNRNPALWKAADEEGKHIYIHHSGNNRSILRSDLKQRSAVQEHQKQANDEEGEDRFRFNPLTDRKWRTYELHQTPQGSSYGKHYPLISNTNQGYLEGSKNTNEKQSFTTKEIGTSENQESPVEYIFTLDDITESMQTVIERPVTKSQSSETYKESQSNCSFGKDAPKSSTTLAKPRKASTESLKTRKCSDVTEKLSQLKTHVVNLIDQTITQFESKQDLSRKEVMINKPTTARTIHPGGDGSELHDRKTQQNVQLLEVESFVRDKQNIRLKLYGEIETMVKRLKDMEFLE